MLGVDLNVVRSGKKRGRERETGISGVGESGLEKVEGEVEVEVEVEVRGGEMGTRDQGLL